MLNFAHLYFLIGMTKRHYYTIILILFILISPKSFAQLKGVITDSLTNEPLMYISVHYEGTGVGAISNMKGEYSVETRRGWNEVTFSAIGYNTKVVRITPGMKVLNVQMSTADYMLGEVVIKPKKERYKKKNNPAVEFMRKVIDHKSMQKLEESDYYSYDTYQKMKTSLNDVTAESLSKGLFKRLSVFTDQVEISPESGKQILPLSIQETVSQSIYRKDPKAQKSIIKGTKNNGVEELFVTGDMIGTMLNEVFTQIDIYDNDIRLLQQRFVSPISNSAISFYKYYLMDTIMVDRHECVHLTFVPMNSQDFGFTGHLYVVNDSTYAVKKCTMNLPKKTGVNFVERMDIMHTYDQLPNGNWVLTDDDMVVDMALIKETQELQVRRTSKYSNYAFEPIDAKLFRQRGEQIREVDAAYKNDEFWAEARQVPLSESETQMTQFVDVLSQTPGFKYLLFGLKLFVENYIETGKPSKFDFGPVNTFISGNYIDGTRLRIGGQTTAQFNPNWFFKGYAAYGIRDEKWKYQGQVTYAFEKREFFPWEFPKHNLSASYRYDVMSPMDKFLTTDKDNVFVSFKTTTVDQMSYVRDAEVKHELETMSGFSVTTALRHRNDEPTGKLAYIRNDADATQVHDITTSEVNIQLHYAPGVTYVNTKQRRLPTNYDATEFGLSHTVGLKDVFGGNYNFNLTEVGIWKRFWLSSWGKADCRIKLGAQWSKVPFPLLILPEANLSYISQGEAFSLINNMEFLNDRYASFTVTYDMNGKFFNRIPLFKRLKWRETFRFRALWGDLTDKNNPYKRPGDSDLFMFPTRNGETTSFVMDPNKPYMEASVGIYNIFKILQIEYVRRLSYLDNPDINKHGIRFMLEFNF